MLERTIGRLYQEHHPDLTHLLGEYEVEGSTFVPLHELQITNPRPEYEEDHREVLTSLPKEEALHLLAGYVHLVPGLGRGPFVRNLVGWRQSNPWPRLSPPSHYELSYNTSGEVDGVWRSRKRQAKTGDELRQIHPFVIRRVTKHQPPWFWVDAAQRQTEGKSDLFCIACAPKRPETAYLMRTNSKTLKILHGLRSIEAALRQAIWHLADGVGEIQPHPAVLAVERTFFEQTCTLTKTEQAYRVAEKLAQHFGIVL